MAFQLARQQGRASAMLEALSHFQEREATGVGKALRQSQAYRCLFAKGMPRPLRLD